MNPAKQKCLETNNVKERIGCRDSRRERRQRGDAAVRFGEIRRRGEDDGAFLFRYRYLSISGWRFRMKSKQKKSTDLAKGKSQTTLRD